MTASSRNNNTSVYLSVDFPKDLMFLPGTVMPIRLNAVAAQSELKTKRPPSFDCVWILLVEVDSSTSIRAASSASSTTCPEDDLEEPAMTIIDGQTLTEKQIILERKSYSLNFEELLEIPKRTRMDCSKDFLRIRHYLEVKVKLTTEDKETIFFKKKGSIPIGDGSEDDDDKLKDDDEEDDTSVETAVQSNRDSDVATQVSRESDFSSRPDLTAKIVTGLAVHDHKTEAILLRNSECPWAA